MAKEVITGTVVGGSGLGPMDHGASGGSGAAGLATSSLSTSGGLPLLWPSSVSHPGPADHLVNLRGKEYLK